MQSNYLVFFLLCTVPLLGQSEEEIMQDADITWAAIHYQDIELDDGITYPNPPYILPEDPEKKDAYVRAYSAKTYKPSPEYFTPSQPRRRFAWLKFNRIWAWDDQNKQLLSYTYSFSPVMGFYDLTSGFPLFQRYYPYVEEQ